MATCWARVLNLALVVTAWLGTSQARANSGTFNPGTFPAELFSVQSKLNLLIYSSPLSSPSGAVFVGRDQALVAQKSDGKVLYFEHGKLSAKVLDLPVASRGRQGLIDIALSPRFSRDGFVYLYHTPAQEDGGVSNSKVVSRYRWDKRNESLTFDRDVWTVSKSPTSTSFSGLITFDSKGRAAIAPASQAGPKVTISPFKIDGVADKLKLFRLGDGVQEKPVVGLIPSYALSKTRSGTLSISFVTELPFEGKNTGPPTWVRANIPVRRGASSASGSMQLFCSLVNLVSVGVPHVTASARVIGGRATDTSQDRIGSIASVGSGMLPDLDAVSASTAALELPAATIDLSSGITQLTSGTLTLPGTLDPSLIDPAPIGPALPAEPVVVPTSLGIINTPEPGILSLGIASFLGAILRRRRRTQRIV